MPAINGIMSIKLCATNTMNIPPATSTFKHTFWYVCLIGLMQVQALLKIPFDTTSQTHTEYSWLAVVANAVLQNE